MRLSSCFQDLFLCLVIIMVSFLVLTWSSPGKCAMPAMDCEAACRFSGNTDSDCVRRCREQSRNQNKSGEQSRSQSRSYLNIDNLNLNLINIQGVPIPRKK